jgi:HD-GYP domain-containing protein (c-di-GMP phosphodiesterase class II)
MQRHVTDGWNMVAGERHLAPFAGSVRGHHERFDGGGYPDGAAGDSIDLSTRIVTVADAFNAMIADRPYRLPLSPTVAIAELQRHRGTQFDPDCVDAMVDVVLGRA